jgi:TetR/AcrR family transcriptional regulator, transcriptional repressor of aconitase
MPKITNEERDRLSAAQRELILQAAWRSFSRNSTLTTSVDDVVREADVTPAMFYLHFQSKEELIRANMESTRASFEDILRALAASDAGSTRIGLVTAVLEAAQSYGLRSDGVNLFRLCPQNWAYAQVDVGIAESLENDYRAFVDFLTQLGRKRWGLTAKEARVHAVLIESIVLGYVVQVALGTGVSVREHIAAYTHLSAN